MDTICHMPSPASQPHIKLLYILLSPALNTTSVIYNPILLKNHNISKLQNPLFKILPETYPTKEKNMPLSHILILGAGPAGLAAALAISQIRNSAPFSPPNIRVTVLELRPSSGSTLKLGGAVNLTPLALRYLDRLGVGARLRRTGIPVHAIDNVALRTGRLLGSLWKGVDALRVMRSELVACMREAADSAAARGSAIEMRYGVRVVSVSEEGSSEADGGVKVVLDDGEEVRGDILLGCDGLHSVARRLYVEPEREETYSGKAVAYGFARVDEPGEAGLIKCDGRPAVEDTAMFTGRYGSILVTFFEPERERLFVAGVMSMKDQNGGGEGGDGWKTKGSDKTYVEGEVRRRFGGGRVTGLAELLETVDD